VVALSERDTDGLLEHVARLAEPLSLEDLRHESVQVVHRLIPSVSASWNEINSRGGIEVVSVPDPGFWPAGPEAFARALAAHPVIAHIRKTNDGRPRAISDFWTAERFHASPLYRDFYSRLHAEDQLSFTVPTPDILIGVAINRDSIGFSSRDRTIANLLRPHILQAYRNAVAQEQIGVLMSIVDNLSSDRAAGLVVLAGTDAAEQVTPAAAELLAKWFPDDPVGHLPDQLAYWLQSLDRQVTRAPTWPLVFEDGGRRLVVRRLQAAQPSDGDVLHVSEHPVGRQGQDLTRLGLSRRQAQVVRMAARGMSNAEIGVELGLSIRTVEGHMAEALERLGVRSRTAAANVIHQLDLGEARPPEALR
jgi:DNA-binding CsgD family transcriptional regulator